MNSPKTVVLLARRDWPEQGVVSGEYFTRDMVTAIELVRDHPDAVKLGPKHLPKPARRRRTYRRRDLVADE